MYQQQEIKFFWPLTEQVPLDLDFKPCQEYDEQKRKEWAASSVTLTSGMGLTIANGGTAVWATIAPNLQPSFTIDVDQTPITIKSKKKPNFIRRYIYKVLGMKWKSE